MSAGCEMTGTADLLEACRRKALDQPASPLEVRGGRGRSVPDESRHPQRRTRTAGVVAGP
jgi:hypothetical protein